MSSKNFCDEPLEYLKTLPVDRRRDEIIRDVVERTDRYAKIPADTLADTLALTLPPDGSWTFYRSHSVESLEYYTDAKNIDEIIEELQNAEPDLVLSDYLRLAGLSVDHLTNEGLEAIVHRLMIDKEAALLSMSGEETAAIRLVFAYNQFEFERDNGINGHATYHLDKSVQFDALLEDDGSCIEIQSPYVVRDEILASLSEDKACFEEEW